MQKPPSPRRCLPSRRQHRGRRHVLWALVLAHALIATVSLSCTKAARTPAPNEHAPTTTKTKTTATSPSRVSTPSRPAITTERPPRIDLVNLDESSLDSARPRRRQLAGVRIGPADLTSARTAEATAAIKLHGASSVGYDQRSYAIEFRDKDERERGLSVLDLPADADWILVACWLDRTCMRNALVYDLAQSLGRWSPQLRWVEVYVNDDYRGLYQLVEAIRGGDSRLDLKRPAVSAADGDITGDYVFRREQAGKSPNNKHVVYDFVSETINANGHRHIFTYHFPRHDDLSDAQRDYLHRFVAGFEANMYAAPDWARITELIDVPSWVDYALVTELAREVDGWMKSLYFVKRRGADTPLALGPLWDYNLAFGQIKHRGGNKTAGWQHIDADRHQLGCSPWLPVPQGCDKCRRGARCGNLPFVPQWAQQLFAAPEFQDALACRWQQLRATHLADANVEQRLRGWHRELERAMQHHYRRWPDLAEHKRVRRPVARDRDMLASTPLPELLVGDDAQRTVAFDEEVAWLAEWLRRRSDWLDNQWHTCPAN